MNNKDFVYKNVLVVGNGFDINLGLKTSYSDYLESNEFKNLCNNNNLAKYLMTCSKILKWVDIENELGNYSRSLFYSLNNNLKQIIGKEEQINSLRKEYYEVCESLREYLNILYKNKNINLENKEAFKVISETLRNEHKTYILTFNYTDTIEDIKNVYFKTRELNINHIHGILSSTGIVFGVEDTAKLPKEHVFLYKSYNEKQNINGLTSIFENADNFTFFGYSLGQTDHSYFRDFFKSQTKDGCKKKNFTFYHYGKEAYDDLIWQLQKLTDNHLTDLKNYNNIKFVDVRIEEENRQC